MINQVKTRFCPSPTGHIHLGNARTALFSFLLAQRSQGVFLLRIEDTDRERSTTEYADQLMQDLLWLQLAWQEGPGCDLGAGPYYQSQRQEVYDDYYNRLQTAGAVYPCFCSEEELALVRKLQIARSQPPRYAGTCRQLSQEEIDKKIAQGFRPVLRFQMPENELVEFSDFVRGPQCFSTDDMGDFIVRRADGTAPFLYCNAIDDALMGVTHVLRGEDHLTNTPRQILILQALGLSVPSYGHIALIISPDQTPLSKRDGSRSIKEMRQKGYLALALNNYMARLGHHYGNDALLSLEDLSSQFKEESLGKSPAKFNQEQLDHWQKLVVMQLTEEECWAWLEPYVSDLVPANARPFFLELMKNNITFPAEAKHWAEILFTDYLPTQEQKDFLSGIDKNYFSVACETYENTNGDLNAIIAALKKNLDIKGPALYQPLRVILTGMTHGPELAKILQLIPADLAKKRLKGVY